MNLIKILCRILDVTTNPTIILVAVIEFVLMCVSIYILMGYRSRIKVLNSKAVKKTGRMKEGKGKVTKTIELEVKKNWEEFDQFLEEYQKSGWVYSAFSLIIQIFTLLGILGTVAGLYLAMSNGQDMYEGVELALSTTILGILFAIIYKVVDIVIESVFINYIEDGINRYEKIYKVDTEEALPAAVADKEN